MASEMSVVQLRTLEDLMISSFNEQQIELYYESKKKAAYKKQQLILFHRQKRLARKGLMRSVLVTLILGSLLFYGVYLHTELANRGKHIAVMQDELSLRIRENADAKKRIEDTVNIIALRDKAIAYGMVYPDADAIFYYTIGDEDYMSCY